MIAMSKYDLDDDRFLLPVFVLAVRGRTLAVCPVSADGRVFRVREEPAANWLPDTDHPATLGCLEHGLVRRAYGGECVDVEHRINVCGEHWLRLTVHTDDGPKVFKGLAKTCHEARAAALLAALEAAP